MILKWIHLTAHPGRRAELLERQKIWNHAMSRESGFLRIRVATDPDLPDELFVLIEIQGRSDLDRFMAEVHDELERASGIREAYRHCETRILELAES